MAILKNRARCKKCDDVVESVHRHDWKQCKCGAIFVDGGKDYIRRGWDGGSADEVIEELSEFDVSTED